MIGQTVSNYKVLAMIFMRSARNSGTIPPSRIKFAYFAFGAARIFSGFMPTSSFSASYPFKHGVSVAGYPQSKNKIISLGLPDLDQAKASVLGSLRSPESQRGYPHSIHEFIS